MSAAKSGICTKHIESIFSEINGRYGDIFRLDDNGECAFKLREKYEVLLRLSPSGSSFKLFSFVQDQEHAANSELMTELMRCNFSSDFLCGFMLGMNEPRKKVVLIGSIQIPGLDSVAMDNVIQNYGAALGAADDHISDFLRHKKPIMFESSTHVDVMQQGFITGI